MAVQLTQIFLRENLGLNPLSRYCCLVRLLPDAKLKWFRYSVDYGRQLLTTYMSQ